MSTPEHHRQSFAERLGVSGAAVSSLEPKHPVVRLAVRVAIVLLIVGCIVLAVTKESGRLSSVDWHFEPGWLALCVLSLLLFQIVHIEIWRLMLRALGGEVAPRQARSIWSLTLIARYVPTSALMALGRIALCERERVPKRVTVASIAYELALTVLTSLALSVYLLWRLPAFDNALKYVAVALPVLGLVALHPRIFHTFADYALKRLGRPPLPLSLPFGRVLEFAAMYVVSFLIAGVSVLAMAHTLHPLGAGDSAIAIASYGLGYVAGVLAFVIPGRSGRARLAWRSGCRSCCPRRSRWPWPSRSGCCRWASRCCTRWSRR